jgi:hypothetical protein
MNNPFPPVPVSLEQFRNPPRSYGILPFWFLNGELEPNEMRRQLQEFRAKGMPGLILHGRYGLEMPYIGPTFLDRIKLAVEEAEALDLQTWIYDEMNWPSGTADRRVLQKYPELSQKYLECISFTVRGPWFTYLTGADSRYLDFERSRPVAAFAMGSEGKVIDLTPNLSFEDVIPWEAPEGNWRLMYIVEKEAEYYIDALDPEATRAFLEVGYEPYAEVVGDRFGGSMVGFYTDEPAMHYYLTGGDNPIVPWSKEMFRRFYQRNGYSLRARLPDLFFDINDDSARVRYDFYNSLTDFYSEAYYKQIHEWCQKHNVLFTGHLLYEEWLRKMIRVEGNLFKHYAHMDIIGVDHLYPFIGNRDRPDEHVAMKVASSAAHHLGSERLLCESFGGIFMDATMQRMKWIADWEYVLGVNLLNPHGFHYTLEGARKRDWPPSMFYQYPWWRYYGHFSDYISRLSSLLSGGSHVAKVAVLWPINSMFATYRPQSSGPRAGRFGRDFNPLIDHIEWDWGHLAHRAERDFNVLTDLLLRLHYDFDYVDEDILASADCSDGAIQVRDERYELLIIPPMTHLKLSTVEQLERFVEQGGRALGMIFLPDQAFDETGLVDVSEHMKALFGVDPRQSQQEFTAYPEIDTVESLHNGGKTVFLRSYALARNLPMRLQEERDQVGRPDSVHFVVEQEKDVNHHFYVTADGTRREITGEVAVERQAVADALQKVLNGLITPDVIIDNPEVFYLHRIKDGRDIYFLVNTTYRPQRAKVQIKGSLAPLLWDPSTGEERAIAPFWQEEEDTCFHLDLPPVGSAFVLTTSLPAVRRIVETNVEVDAISTERITAHALTATGYLVLEQEGRLMHLTVDGDSLPDPLVLDGEWEFEVEDPNALVINQWLTKVAEDGASNEAYTAENVETRDWLPMVGGAWSYQLPTEPEAPYPLQVWHRCHFQVDHLPTQLHLLVDGFAASSWQLFVNGEAVDTAPVRSHFDSQINSVEITDQVRLGNNRIALCLTLTKATDGLLDPLKLAGDFSLAQAEDGGYTIAAPRATVEPSSWTEQGYPFLSGQAIYRRRLQIPDSFANCRLFLEAPTTEDVLEVSVNGESTGVCLWDPYRVEVTPYLQVGENLLELRVANTLINLLEATPRRSGLAGPPRLVAHRNFVFKVNGGGE